MVQLIQEASGTPNALAFLALLGWPVVALATFAWAARNGRDLARTTAWMMVVPVMFLPANFGYKLPGIPVLDKHRIAFLSIAVALEIFHRRPPGDWVRGRIFVRGVLLVLVLGVVQTVQTNGDFLVYGPRVLPGLTSHDILSVSAALVIDVYLPFAVGERVFRSESSIRALLEVLSLSAIVYAPLALFEIRFSPQLHYWIYGYAQHQFLQSMRGGGFRPVVFMNHGLSVAMFLFTGLLASAALVRTRRAVQPVPARWRAAATALLLLLSRSFGAILDALLAVPLVLRGSPRLVARVAVVVVAIAFAYPVLRTTDLVPDRDIVDVFAQVSPDRAESLRFRFINEEALAAKARERPIYGWGTWGRNRVYAPWGQDISVTDGEWIILLGTFGLVGVLGFFLLLVVPVLRYWRNRDRMSSEQQVLVGALALLVALLALDLVPNARSDFLGLAYAGALLAVAGTVRARARAAPRAVAPEARPVPAARAGAPLLLIPGLDAPEPSRKASPGSAPR